MPPGKLLNFIAVVDNLSSETHLDTLEMIRASLLCSLFSLYFTTDTAKECNRIFYGRWGVIDTSKVCIVSKCFIDLLLS